MSLVAKLVVIKGPSKNMFCVVTADKEATIGRNPQCAIPIPDPKLSRIHCVVRQLDNSSYEILDNNSTNGIFLASERVEFSSPLKSGDVIELGDSLIKFIIEEENQPTIKLPPGASPLD